MKFWKNLIKSINRISDWMSDLGNVVISQLKSMDDKLVESKSYIANENPIKIIDSSVTLVLACNEVRNKIIIQNIGIEPCYIKLDNDIYIDHFHCVLAPDSYPCYGNGGSITLDNWHGEVYAFCEKVTEITVLEY